MNIQKKIKLFFSILLVVIFVFFFYREFRANWNSFSNLKLTIDWGYLSAGLLMMVLNYLCVTMSWQIGINGLKSAEKLSFKQSIALVNISQLGKYIPGKLWSYVIQIYWLSSKGFPKTAVLYLNIIATILSVFVSLMLGGLFLLLTGWHYLRGEIILLVVIVLISNFVLFNRTFLRYIIYTFSRITGKEISFYPISSYRVILMELIYLISAVFWALAGCFIALGIGFDLDSLKILFISAAMLLGDVIGFLILIAPGGLGVREGTMFLILKGTGIIQFALIMPIAVRLLSIVTDLIMGILSALIISRSKYFSRNNI
jgi:uncharacterized membrane protein YbhN (UPF0104 family)